ncbi:MAG: sugar phosphate isomerase/epimerase family protein [Pseudomonadota bacterium]
MFDLSLCNEVLRDLAFADQCKLAAELGYAGLEVAPFTLSDAPDKLTNTDLSGYRQIVEDHGLLITGLHWLLIAPAGLSITTDDANLRQRTTDVMRILVDMCAALGGTVLVHGSPAQRRLGDAGSPSAARDNAVGCLASVAEAAQAAGVTYCIEPLAPRETDFINTVSEAVEIVETVNNPALKTMIDTSAAALAEDRPVAEIIRQWWPSGHLAHIQVNDRNQRAPGQGEDRFGPVFEALSAVGFTGPVAVEPFDYRPDGPTTAAVASGYLRGIMEGVA